MRELEGVRSHPVPAPLPCLVLAALALETACFADIPDVKCSDGSSACPPAGYDGPPPIGAYLLGGVGLQQRKALGLDRYRYVITDGAQSPADIQSVKAKSPKTKVIMYVFGPEIATCSESA